MTDTEFLITKPASALSELFEEKALYRAKRLENKNNPIWVAEYYAIVNGSLRKDQSFLEFLKENYLNEDIHIKTSIQIVKDCICAKQLEIPNDTDFLQIERKYFLKKTLIGLEKIFVDVKKQAFEFE